MEYDKVWITLIEEVRYREKKGKMIDLHILIDRYKKLQKTF